MVIVIALLVGLIVMSIPSTSAKNCGGNNYTLSNCKHFALAARMVADENAGLFTINKIESQDLTLISMDRWGSAGSDFLVKTNFLITNQTNREIVIVSQRAFANVPQPTFWSFYRKHWAHAVGYSDGSADLISPKEFSKLNLNGFVSIKSLVTNSEAKISK